MENNANARQELLDEMEDDEQDEVDDDDDKLDGDGVKGKSLIMLPPLKGGGIKR